VFAPFVVDIAEDGKSLGTTRHGKLMIAPGKHHLRSPTPTSRSAPSRMSGHRRRRQPGAPRSEGHAASTPSVGEVWSDARSATPIANYELPLGSHEFVFKHPQFASGHGDNPRAQPATVATGFTTALSRQTRAVPSRARIQAPTVTRRKRKRRDESATPPTLRHATCTIAA
jgi:hypothetical protein